MARSLIDELEELLFQDTKEFYLKSRARRAGVRGSVSIIEPSQIGIKKTKLPGSTYEGFGRDPYENQSQKPQPQDWAQGGVPVPGTTTGSTTGTTTGSTTGSTTGTSNPTSVSAPSQNTEQATLQSFTLELPPSSTIQTATYWPGRQYLTVSFKSGHTYSYDDVPFKVMVAWKMAPSAGSFFYYNIRTSFRYQKI
jgi:hypothetical protein